MNVQTIQMDPRVARVHYADYRKACRRHGSGPQSSCCHSGSRRIRRAGPLRVRPLH